MVIKQNILKFTFLTLKMNNINLKRNRCYSHLYKIYVKKLVLIYFNSPQTLNIFLVSPKIYFDRITLFSKFILVLPF